MRARSGGTFSCTRTRFWRIWMIFSGWSMKTGQTSWQAPQVVQAHSTSSVVRPPMSGLTCVGRRARRRAGSVSSSASSGPRSGMRVRMIVAHVVDDLHRRQRLAGVVGRAEVRAARALGAGEPVEQRLPGEVFPLLNDAGGRDVVGLHVQLGQDAALAELAEVDVGQRRQDVAVLRVEQVVQERQQDDHVGPPADLGERLIEALHPEVGHHQQADRREDGGGVAAHRDEARLQHDAPEEGEHDHRQHGDEKTSIVGVRMRAAASAPMSAAQRERREQPLEQRLRRCRR